LGIYKSLKAGDLKDLAELHCGRQVQEKFGHLVKKSLENIYKVQKNPALETTLIETDKVVRQNIARVQSFIKKLEISAPSTSTLDTIETKLTEAQFSHIFSDDDDPSTPAPPTPSKQPRCPKVKSESPLEQQGKKLKHLNSRPAHEGYQSVCASIVNLSEVLSFVCLVDSISAGARKARPRDRLLERE
jgi:hypothetical protein